MKHSLQSLTTALLKRNFAVHFAPGMGNVITEAMHFVSAVPDGAANLAELVAVSSMEVFDLTQPSELREAAALMDRYSDIPMDFADATLVLLAEAIGVHDILTLDRRGFAVFRTRENRPLRNVFDVEV